MMTLLGYVHVVFQGSGGVANANVAARREINAKIRLNKILLRFFLRVCLFVLVCLFFILCLFLCLLIWREINSKIGLSKIILWLKIRLLLKVPVKLILCISSVCHLEFQLLIPPDT